MPHKRSEETFPSLKSMLTTLNGIQQASVKQRSIDKRDER